MSSSASPFIVVDTSVLAHLTKSSRVSVAYDSLIGQRIVAISFQTEAELLSSDYAARRQALLDNALSLALKLPHTDRTSFSYARVIASRKELKRARKVGGDAGDADVWIIASADEHRIPLVSHDRHMVALARAVGLFTFTALPMLRGDNPR